MAGLRSQVARYKRPATITISDMQKLPAPQSCQLASLPFQMAEGYGKECLRRRIVLLYLPRYLKKNTAERQLHCIIPVPMKNRYFRQCLEYIVRSSLCSASVLLL